MCIMSVYTLLTVVGYYDLSVLSLSLMGFQKKKFGCVSSIQVCLDSRNCLNFAKPLGLPDSPFYTGLHQRLIRHTYFILCSTHRLH